MASCISSATGTLIFAIINIIGVTLWSATVLGLGIYMVIATTAVAASRYSAPVVAALSIVEIAVFIVLLFVSLITLVFSSLLLDGILKKKASYLKAYFIYGIIVVVLTLLSFLVTMAMGASDFHILSSDFIPLFCAYVIYGLILYMIRHAYIKMEIVADQYEPKPLVKNEYC